MFRIALVAAVGLSVSACCAVNTACTLIGCIDGVRISSFAPAPSDVSITVTAPDGSARTATCAAGQSCFAEWADWEPQSVTVEITYDGQTTIRNEVLDYETTQPNGPCCGPTCRSATIALQFQ